MRICGYLNVGWNRRPLKNPISKTRKKIRNQNDIIHCAKSTWHIHVYLQKWAAVKNSRPMQSNPESGNQEAIARRIWNPENICLWNSGIILFGIRNPDLGIRNPGKPTFWNPESTEVESWIKYLGSGVHIMEFGIHWGGILNQVPGIRSPYYGIRNPRLPWITQHGAKILLGST